MSLSSSAKIRKQIVNVYLEKFMKIGQVAYTYKPIIGGCETYIETIRNIINDAGYSQRIYQVKKENISDSQLRLVPVLHLFKRKPLFFFNLFLNLYFADLFREDILIVHDPFHFFPVFWHKCIVISHGVRWDRPQKSELLYCKLHLISAKFAMKYAYQLVANDSNFYRQLGYRLKPKKKMFQEIMPNRWFIPNCINTSVFKKVKPIPSLSALNPILVPRNIVRGRGIHLAISAFKKISKFYKNTNLVICGDFSDPKYKFEIFQQIGDLGLIGKVYFIGSVKWLSMPQVYSSALMTIIPTLYEEGTSLAALESMSCGTLTISTNVGGLQDLPTVKANPNSDDLAKTMIESFRSRKVIAKKQQKEVRTTFNLDNFRKAWMKVIHRAASKMGKVN